MTDQGQHRISQIYLKQFGFKDVNKRWRISVHEIGNPGVHEKSIKSFTKETNIFDVTLFDDEIPEIRRYFESNSSRLENFYPSVIRKIKKKNEIDNLSRSILFQFVPNLLCRTYRFRSLLEIFLQPLTRAKFFNEITMFSDDENNLILLKAVSPKLPINEQLNIIIGNVMSHLVKIFETFSMIVLKDFGGRKWMTSDNPVVLDTANDYTWLVPLTTEVYFPLSRHYCLFMFNPNAKTDNELRNVEHGQIIQASGEMHDKIASKITSNVNQYLILPSDTAEFFKD